MYYVSEWPTLQVNIVIVIIQDVAKILKHAAHCCSACFLCSGYIAVFIIPSTWSFYLTSVLIGIGAASKFPYQIGNDVEHMTVTFLMFAAAFSL